MNLFTQPCATCGGTVFGPRVGGKARGQWLGYDECLDCRKASTREREGEMDRDMTDSEARLLEAFGPLEMARLIDALLDEMAWIQAFATVRSQDDSKTFARVNRGALRTIADRARTIAERVSA